MPPRTSLPPTGGCRCWSPRTATSSTNCCASPRPAAPRSSWPPIRPPPGPAGRRRRWCWSAPTRRRRACGPDCRNGRADGAGRPVRAARPGWGLAELIGAEHVVVLPAAEPWLVDRLAEWRRPRPAAAPPRIVAVLGGRGGAGASVLAGGLAVTAARARLRTLLVDADPLGGGLDLVLGWEELDGLRWPALDRGRAAGWTRRRWSARCPAGATWSCSPGTGATCWRCPPRRWRPPWTPAGAAGTSWSSTCPASSTRRPWSRSGRRPALRRGAGRAAGHRGGGAGGAAAAPHCADLKRDVRGPAPAGSRPTEVARALDLPLAGTLRPSRGCAGGWSAARRQPRTGRGPLAALCQRIVDRAERPRANRRVRRDPSAAGGAGSGRPGPAPVRRGGDRR